MVLTVDIERDLPGFQLRVSFTCRDSTLGLLGSSGSGKSMTLRCIAGLDRPTRGRITLGEKILYDSEAGINLPPQERKVGFLFQNYALFPHLTVSGNIKIGLRGLEKKKQAKIIQEIITRVKLEGLEGRYPRQLSGGQQQRAALARALVLQPQLLLLDEPFSALDNHLRSEMEQELKDLLNTFHGSSVFVTHNLEEAYRLCPDLLILEDGNVITCGSREDIFNRPPNLATARITGCQNLSRIRVLQANTVEALDWGCLLRLSADNMVGRADYVGIYSRHIRPAGKDDHVNTMHCRVINVMESPHQVTLSVKPAGGETNNTCCLKLSISNEEWSRMAPQSPDGLKICMPPERVFLTCQEDE